MFTFQFIECMIHFICCLGWIVNGCRGIDIVSLFFALGSEVLSVWIPSHQSVIFEPASNESYNTSRSSSSKIQHLVLPSRQRGLEASNYSDVCEIAMWWYNPMGCHWGPNWIVKPLHITAFLERNLLSRYCQVKARSPTTTLVRVESQGTAQILRLKWSIIVGDQAVSTEWVPFQTSEGAVT